jgi:hypothetical protein
MIGELEMALDRHDIAGAVRIAGDTRETIPLRAAARLLAAAGEQHDRMGYPMVPALAHRD